MHRILFISLASTIVAPAFAGEADVLNVQVSCTDERICDFAVTVQHTDEGWEHYADRWEVRTLDGKQLAIRELAHPHDHEQPFTRALNNVEIPEGLTALVVRARDSKHRYGGKEVTVSLEQ